MVKGYVLKSVYQKITVLRVVVQVLMQNCLKKADTLSVEVSVLSLREGKSRRLFRCCGRKSELVAFCDGVYSEVLSRRFDSDVESFLRGLSGGYILEEVALISDGISNGGRCVYSVSGMCTRLS